MLDSLESIFGYLSTFLSYAQTLFGSFSDLYESFADSDILSTISELLSGLLG